MVRLARLGLILLAIALTGCVSGPLDHPSLRVMTYNIHHGQGMDGELDLERIAALIRENDPDLVALQEVDLLTNRTARVDQAAELARLVRMHHAFARFMFYDGGEYGLAVLSKSPIVESRIISLPPG